MYKWDGRAVFFTRHTTERLLTFGYSFDEGLKLFASSKRYKIPDKAMREYKREKYGGNDGIFYTMAGTVLFVVRDTIDYKYHLPCWLVITATNTLINKK